MQARRAARELALILFSQFDKEITKYSRKDFHFFMWFIFKRHLLKR